MYSDRYDSFVPNVTDDYIWFERTQSSGTSARCLDRCWASVVDGGPALVRFWAGVPFLLGGYPLSVGSVLVHVFGAVPPLPRHWVDPDVCWNLQYCVIMLLFGCLVQHTIFSLHTFGVTYKPKWAGYYIYCKNIYIVIVIILPVHVTIIKIYNTIQYNSNKNPDHINKHAIILA